MRSREEINTDVRVLSGEDGKIRQHGQLIIEVLLDIRDLLEEVLRQQ